MRTYCPGDRVPIQFEHCDAEVKVRAVNLCLDMLNRQRAHRELKPSQFSDTHFFLPDDITSHVWTVVITTGYHLEATTGERLERTRCHTMQVSVKPPRVKATGTFEGKNTRPLIKECC